MSSCVHRHGAILWRCSAQLHERRCPMRRLLTLFGCLGAGVVQAADPNYHVVSEIQIGGEGGWDYLILDPAAHRLYVPHATKVVVADVDTGKVVGEIPNTPGVHG